MHRAEGSPHLVRRLGLWGVEACQDLRGRRLPWLATAFGCGIGIYFALPAEPSAGHTGLLALLMAVCLALARRARNGAGIIALLLATAVGGVLAGVGRTAIVSGPVLDFRYYGAVEGRVIVIDRSASDAVRITLDHVRLDGVPPQQTPRRVRVSLHDGTDVRPFPGDWVMTTAHLSAPNGPTEPGGFDFQRHAWFLQLGAIGYARVPLLRMAPTEHGAALALVRLRGGISDGLRSRLPGTKGEVAAAITTGDRSGLAEDVVAALRASNLAHLLAISGLHMGLLVGFVFWTVRGGLALWPAVALRFPTRAWAALVSLPFAVFYLFLSGGSVATQRAFVMAAVMLGAILLGRRALSLRSVALAALLVLAWRPESLAGPGFQMSFAATGALVIAFRSTASLRSHDRWGHWFTGWRGAVLSLLLSSIVAGAATAPIAALHFNRVGQFGVLANLLAVPAMGLLVMPMLLVALLLWPLGLGLEAAPLWLAGHGIGWIVWVARGVADLPGSVGYVQAPGGGALPLLGGGMAVFACSLRWGRWIGGMLIVLAGALWLSSPRPDLLIASDGRLVGRMTDQGRWLSRDEGAAFAAASWLENDGDGASQKAAAGRDGGNAALPDIIALRGKTGLAEALARCGSEPIWIVTPVRVDGDHGRCTVIDEAYLRGTGAIAVYVEESGPGPASLRTVTSSESQGTRPWTRSGRNTAGQ